jgi:tetratricopeptide (TPR) repeat protein
MALSASAAAAPLKATLTVTVGGGYARLLFSSSEYIDATTRVSGHVLIITFKQPVDVGVARVPEQAPDYIGAARRDPDGKAIRMALAQDVTVNMMGAGEKLFIDLLPASWSGPPPSLPQDVVNELARRAREAEAALQRERQLTQAKYVAPIRVHVATQPTFTRYIFDVSNQTAVAADRAKDRLVLNFDAPLTFDLADAQAALPNGVKGISSELEKDSSLVRFVLGAGIDVRTFRDEKGYVVDIVNPDAINAQAPATVPLAGSGSEGTPSPEAAAAALHAVASSTAQSAFGPATLPALPLESRAPSITPPAPHPAAPSSGLVQPAPQSTPAPPMRAASPAVPSTPETTLPPGPAPGPVAQAAPQPVAQTAPASMPQAETPPAAQPASPPAPLPAPPGTQTEPAPAPQPAAVPPAQGAAPPVVSAAPVPAAPTATAPVPAAPTATAPVPAAPTATAPVPVASKPAAAKDSNTIAVEFTRDGANLKLSFPFKAPVPIAVFHRADTLWLVFDTKTNIDLAAIEGEPSRTIRSYELTHVDEAAVIRLQLDRPHLSSVVADGAMWTVQIGDSVLEPSRALELSRNMIGPNRATVTIAFDEPQQMHRLIDPQAGDALFVVTGFAPARGILNEQDFIEFRTLPSTQGIVIEPLADDLSIKLAADKVVVDRPTGLTLSPSLQTLLHGRSRPVTFDSQIWGSDRQGSYIQRQADLIYAAAQAPEGKRMEPRLDLARFYLARDMYPEAKGVLDVAIADDKPAAKGLPAVVLRAIAEIMMNRPGDALKDLSNPGIGDQHDAPLWRALAFAQQGQWARAREGFKSVEAAVATLPIELQRVALKDEMRSAIEVGDFDGATADLNDFQTIGVPREMQPLVAVLAGRLDEGMGRLEDALQAYRTAADSWDRPVAAQGLLRETLLRYALGDLKRDDVIAQLESLTTIWRGDETEIEALKVLAHLYTEEGRYRDAFYVMRSAMAAHPDSAMTRQIQDEAAATFDSLFLTPKGDTMAPVDALALFYDFRELTPVGSRGDEMIRRLAERLVSVDLLDQAADLLQYQVDHRLQGAARAQVGTRLAVIYLMNRKADRALATLRATRMADLSNELRNQRLLLEGRALSDLGRHDLALEVIANIDGREAIRLRSDILWAAKRWDQAAEQIELMYGDRYKDFAPLSDVEQQDILRAEIGYALSGDALGLGRFREKYAAKMAQTPDAHVFEIVSSPLGSSGEQFAAIAHAATSIDTLEGFLRDLQARYPESASASPSQSPPPAPPQAASQPPGLRPSAPVLPPAAPARASGRTAMR